MEKTETTQNAIIEKLKTPLGFGIALLTALGVGYVLSKLFKKSKNSNQATYQKLVQEIKELLKQETGASQYSINLIKKVFDCAGYAAQPDFNKIYHDFVEKRRATVDSIKDYVGVVMGHSGNMRKVLNNAFQKIMDEAGGSFQTFKSSEESLVRQNQELLDQVVIVFDRLESNVPRKPNTQKIDKSLLKKIYEYKLGKIAHFRSQKINEALMAAIIKTMLRDKVYQEFGVDMETVGFVDKEREFGGSDPEIRGLQERIRAAFTTLLVD